MRVEGALISSDSAPSWLPVYTSKDVGYLLLPFLFAGTFNMQMRLGWVLARVSQIRSTFSTLPSFASRKRKGFANNNRGGVLVPRKGTMQALPLLWTGASNEYYYSCTIYSGERF